ncbi:hypothetical protein Asi03nite_17940 [Actinoplanes siamensis]|uniref:Diguanylate cyclase n=1 Tax=Actinoplanes siamensis TaxID=1223317 RepID=A0A919N4J1_9ACTN|nr:hypothetical protein Asi03nite_17940 [Actinoplanes siamensis]
MIDGQTDFEFGKVGNDSFRALVELSPDTIFVICEGYHAFVNARGLALLGARTLTDLQDRPAIEFMHPDYRDPGAARMRSLTADGTPLQYVEEKLVRLDGTVVDIEAAGTPLEFNGRPAALIVARDITERKRAESELAAAQQRFHAAFRHAPTGMAMLDATGSITEVNPALEALLSAPAAEIVGGAYWDWVDVADREQAQAAFHVMADGTAGTCEGDLSFRRADDRHVCLRICVAPLADNGSFIAHVIDVTAAKATERELVHQARMDPLTQLPNRAALLDQLARALTKRLTRVAVLFLDLDDFKPINDRYGHAVGDELLQLIAHRLRRAIRADDLVGRLGGDEFVVVLASPDCKQRADALATRICEVVERPATLTAGTIRVGVSIGIAVGTGVEYDATGLLAAADTVMYQSKAARR